MKLTIELIPKSSFFKNVRSEVSRSEWDTIRKNVYKQADYKCEVCHGKGNKWPIECHEIFSYDADEKIQKLERLIALCPSCHQVKHIGLARVKGNYEKALDHFCRINETEKKEAEAYVDECFKVWQNRNCIQWKLDLTNLQKYL